jgi:hypothetical protein
MDLRPLSVGETLDRSFGIYRRLLVPLLLIQLVCVAPVYPFQLYFVGSGRQFSGGYFLFALIGFVLSSLASAATALLIAERYLGRELSAGDSIRRSLPRVGAVVAVSLLIGLVLMISFMPTMLALAAGGGLAAFSAQAGSGSPSLGAAGVALGLMMVGVVLMVLPVIVASALAVSLPALIVEHINAGAALSRSWALTKGRRVRVAFTLFVFLLILMVPYIGLGLIFGFATAAGGEGTLLLFVLQYAISILLTPLLYCVVTLLYFDLRVRREAFDLEMLAGQVATA